MSISPSMAGLELWQDSQPFSTSAQHQLQTPVGGGTHQASKVAAAPTGH